MSKATNIHKGGKFVVSFPGLPGHGIIEISLSRKAVFLEPHRRGRLVPYLKVRVQTPEGRFLYEAAADQPNLVALIGSQIWHPIRGWHPSIVATGPIHEEAADSAIQMAGCLRSHSGAFAHGGKR